jgi:hypothetical protein
MTTKAAFNAEEWELVTSAPAMAAMSVVAADRGGTLRESVSMARAYTDARREGGTELLRELLSSPPVVDPSTFQPGGDAVRLATERLRSAISLLEARATPEEVEDYRRFVMDLSETVARAHKEGGILGVGGKPVSEREQAVLDEIATTLGVPQRQQQQS